MDSTISQLREYVDEEDEATREEMREGFNQVNSTISNLSEHVDEKFGEIDDKFVEVDSTLSSIQGVIPDQAYEDGNELADKVFVNSSIQTNTASFKGTYNNHENLGLPNTATHEQIAEKLQEAIDAKHLTYDDNDYAFVEIPHDDSEPTVFERIERYKCVKTSEEGVEPATFQWEYEWTLNNSSFTADQWAAINSGITSGLVQKIGIEARKLFPVTGGNDTFISGDCAIYQNNTGSIQDTKWIRDGSNPGTYVYDGTEETPYKWFFSTYSYTLVYNKSTGEVTNGGTTVLGRIPKKPGTDEYPDPALDDLGTFTYTPPNASTITFTFKPIIPVKVDSVVKKTELTVELAKKLDDKNGVITSNHLTRECVKNENLADKSISRGKFKDNLFDSAPTTNSKNLLESGTIKTALDSIETELVDYVKMEDLVDGLQVDEISAKDITIDGKKPSLEGHTHEIDDVSGLEDRFSELDSTLTNHISNKDNPHGVTKAQIISAGSITTTDIANQAITNEKIANNSISDAKLQGDGNNGITSTHFKTNAFHGAKLTDGTVTMAKLAEDVNAKFDAKKDDFTVGTGLVETPNKLYAYRGVEGTTTERELRYTIGPADVGSAVYSWNGSTTIPTGETVKTINTTIGRIYTVSLPKPVYYDRSTADDIARPGVISIDETVVAKKNDVVPNSRTVNGQPLSSDVTLTGADIAYNDSTTVSAKLSLVD